ncbi:hypothetical protein EDD99_5165 [Streptomyces sp. 846.5]|nr:hypothetical protein [Streptomyces sp. 846.5]TDU06602.1 hypothetical protein EDD99_5165 [Streptomyces sp. 846.5]
MSLRTTLLPSALAPSHLLSSPTRNAPAWPGRTDYRLGNPGHPSEVPTLLIADFDNSGSVTSPAGTDPLSNRFAEVARAFSVVARNGAQHELGVVMHFDTPSRGDVGPVPITRRGLTRLKSGLHVPADGAGSSELRPSLRRAVEIAEAHPDHEATLVVLSDFWLLDPEPANVFSELATFPGDVHAVVLGAHLAADALDERITVTHIERGDPPGAVARALFSSLVAHRPGSHVHKAVLTHSAAAPVADSTTPFPSPTPLA